MTQSERYRDEQFADPRRRLPPSELDRALTIEKGVSLGRQQGRISQPTEDLEATWHEVPGWPAYEVSSCGLVRRALPSKGTRAGRLLRQNMNVTTGYYSVCLSSAQLQKRIDVHRLVALAFHGPQPTEKHLVAHNDGIRTNNRAENLRWATQAENLQDCRLHGTAMLGAKNPSTSLSEVDVLAMRRMKSIGIPRPVIATEYGIHKRSVFKILAGTSWEHVA